MRITRGRRGGLLAATALGLCACAGKSPEGAGVDDPKRAAARAAEEARNAPDTCPATAQAPALLPGVSQEHLSVDYWLARAGDDKELDRVLMDPQDIARLNASMRVAREDFYPQRDLLVDVDVAEVQTRVDERLVYLKAKLDEGKFVGADGGALTPTDLTGIPADAVKPSLRVALAPIQIYCGPRTDSFHTPPPDGVKDPSQWLDRRIDHNACSTVREQEPLHVLAAWPAGMQLVRTRYAMGWVAADAPLSQVVPAAQRSAWIDGPFASVIAADAAFLVNGADVQLPVGTRLPLATVARKSRRGSKGFEVRVATADGFGQAAGTPDRLRLVDRPLTRRAALTEAFRMLGAPYGYGGKDAGIDCSRMFMDVFESFGLRLPRHSSWQARAGAFSIGLDGVSEKDRLILLDTALERGIVLMQLPGHIMMYLGRDEAGQPMALHAFAEYKEPCATPDPENAETTMRVDSVQVSNLELGRGTSKRAFIERITRIAVLGEEPGLELAGAADLRPPLPVVKPKRCRTKSGMQVFVSPRYPNVGQPLTVVATAGRNPGPVELALVDPTGNIVRPTPVRLGGPPFGFAVQVEQPARGRWQVLFGEGEDIRACTKLTVASRVPHHVTELKKKRFKRVDVRRRAKDDEDDEASLLAPPPIPLMGSMAPVVQGVPVWKVRRGWSSRMEDLFAVFVERLFDYPADEDLTWNGLQVLLQDRKRNILHDYFSLQEEDQIKLFPDCAELSYMLRAYFSWKLGLPFAYTRCTRAKPNKPPVCEPAGDNLMTRAVLGRDDEDDVGSFIRFTAAEVGTAVHSSSGRTHPDDELSDYYPVKLTHDALRPGTLYNDPYGHVMVVSKWIPQTATGYGMLMAADAQPDGTIGRRRFWRGSFLFITSTDSGGAGFKAYRPVFYRKAEGIMERLENKKLAYRSTPWSRYGTEMYRGKAADFYRSMEALINPRTLDPLAVQTSLVDALQESVVRRVVSVDTGETYMAEHGFAVIDMPSGRRIFLTSGPWEDFSTPSRDLRLLIAIDTVVQFPGEVRATPERFGVESAEVDARVAALEKALRAELERRTFEYKRSDGAAETLTLADIADRAKAFEISYNPNDCPEIRWGAPEGSSEMKSCARRAPPEQRAEMEKVRRWFSTRSRPAN